MPCAKCKITACVNIDFLSPSQRKVRLL